MIVQQFHLLLVGSLPSWCLNMNNDDLYRFKGQHTVIECDGSTGFKECLAMRRLMVALQYRSFINAVNNQDDHEIFTNFVNEYYPQFSNDCHHFQGCHSFEIGDIHAQLITCNTEQCHYTVRHPWIETDTNDKKDNSIVLCADYRDHCSHFSTNTSDNIKKRNAHYYWMSRYLRECVELFGGNISPIGPVHSGLNVYRDLCSHFASTFRVNCASNMDKLYETVSHEESEHWICNNCGNCNVNMMIDSKHTKRISVCVLCGLSQEHQIIRELKNRNTVDNDWLNDKIFNKYYKRITKCEHIAAQNTLDNMVFECYGGIGGNSSSTGPVYYSGLNAMMAFKSSTARLNCPVSTTKQMAVAHRFGESSGIILQLNNAEIYMPRYPEEGKPLFVYSNTRNSLEIHVPLCHRITGLFRIALKYDLNRSNLDPLCSVRFLSLCEEPNHGIEIFKAGIYQFGIATLVMIEDMISVYINKPNRDVFKLLEVSMTKHKRNIARNCMDNALRSFTNTSSISVDFKTVRQCLTDHNIEFEYFVVNERKAFITLMKSECKVSIGTAIKLWKHFVESLPDDHKMPSDVGFVVVNAQQNTMSLSVTVNRTHHDTGSVVIYAGDHDGHKICTLPAENSATTEKNTEAKTTKGNKKKRNQKKTKKRKGSSRRRNKRQRR
eukprot:149269_1